MICYKEWLPHGVVLLLTTHLTSFIVLIAALPLKSVHMVPRQITGDDL